MKAIRLTAAMLSAASCTFGALATITPAQADDNRVIHTRYDGVTNDLLTAGLGKTGLGSAVPPGFADPLIRPRRSCGASRSTTTIAR